MGNARHGGGSPEGCEQRMAKAEDKVKGLELTVAELAGSIVTLAGELQTLAAEIKTAEKQVVDTTGKAEAQATEGAEEKGTMAVVQTTEVAEANFKAAAAQPTEVAVETAHKEGLQNSSMRTLRAHHSDESTAAPSTVCMKSQPPGGSRIKRPGRRARAREHRARYEECREFFGGEGDRRCRGQEVVLTTAALCSLLEADEDNRWASSGQEGSSTSESEPLSEKTSSSGHEEVKHRHALVAKHTAWGSDDECKVDPQSDGGREEAPPAKRSRNFDRSKQSAEEATGPLLQLPLVGTAPKPKQEKVERGAAGPAIHSRLEPEVGGKANPQAHRDRHVLMELNINYGQFETQRSAIDQADFLLELISCTVELLQKPAIGCGAWGCEVCWMHSHIKSQLDCLEATGGGHFPTVIKEGRRINGSMLNLANTVDGHGYLENCSEADLAVQRSLRELATPWQRAQLALCRATRWLDANPDAVGEAEGLAEILVAPSGKTGEGRLGGTSDADLQALLQQRLATSQRSCAVRF